VIRSLQPEILDSPDIPGPVLDRFHRDLDFINKCLGTFSTIERFIRKDAAPVHRILDIGCGGGALLEYLHRRLGVEVIGIDPKPPAHAAVPILRLDAVTEKLPEADVAVCTLTAHHLTPEQIVALIRNVSRSCRRFIIHDLIRHPLPLVLFTVFLCPFVSHEVGADGRLSIRRAYTPEEFTGMAKQALAGTNGSFTTNISPFRSRQIVDIRFA
jgi:2-polyprenyl-3-methyl-5-hydroxy-6-metoxy-1,4-benzoquinol methylase